MVAAACTSSGLSFLGSKEESKDSNVSFVVLEKHRSGVFDYGLCVTNYEEETQRLLFEMNGESYTYALDVIQEQYYEQVKNNKVTLFRSGGNLIPVVVEKDKTFSEKHPDINEDRRVFIFKSILKYDDTQMLDFYSPFYNWMFLHGFCNAAMQIYEDGRFFFNEKDFDPEYDYSKTDKGYLSAGLALYDSPHDFHRKDNTGEYRYAIVQSYCEGDYLVLRIEDGQIYKFPLNILNIQARDEIQKGKPVSGLQLSNRRWIPVYLSQEYSQYYSIEEVLYLTRNTYNLRKFNNLLNYSDFMLEAGITTSYQPIDYFFYKASKNR